MYTDFAWYALQVRPRFEKIVARSLLSKGYESFLLPLLVVLGGEPEILIHICCRERRMAGGESRSQADSLFE